VVVASINKGHCEKILMAFSFDQRGGGFYCFAGWAVAEGAAGWRASIAAMN
jgi:hypothetical protein